MRGFDPGLAAERRRPLERMEQEAVRLVLAQSSTDVRRLVDELRYVLSFARLIAVRNSDGTDVAVDERLASHARDVRDTLAPHLGKNGNLWGALRTVPDLAHKTRAMRAKLLEQLPIERDALEREVTTRVLAVVSGGGGGAGYGYPGVYEMIERAGLAPDLMVGTSIGALMSMFRARRRHFDLAPMVEAARRLAWGRVFRVLETQNHYGIPAALRLYLRDALGPLFLVGDRPAALSDMEIPLYVVTTGITVDSMKHGLEYYEHLLDGNVGFGKLQQAQRGLVAMNVMREFLSSRQALREVVLGRDEGTQDFDVIDASGFSASIPGVIHYDVLRDDPRMRAVLDRLYAVAGITRLGEGGLVANVPAKIAWEAVVEGRIGGRRNAYVVALDCFSPSRTRIPWYPFQQMVRSSNVTANLPYADLYLPMEQVLSPLNLVPTVKSAMQAISWGKEAMKPHVPLLQAMMRPLPVLPG